MVTVEGKCSGCGKPVIMKADVPFKIIQTFCPDCSQERRSGAYKATRDKPENKYEG